MEHTPYIDPELEKQIRLLFEKRYKRTISKLEVLNIAENLTNLFMTLFKFKCEQNGKTLQA